MTSLIDQYERLIEHPAAYSYQQIKSGDELTNFIHHDPNMYEKELPHVFELVWLLNFPFRKHMHDKSRTSMRTQWSQTPTKVWMPNTQLESSMLYQTFVSAATEDYIDIQIHKASHQAANATALVIPVNDTINRKYETTDEEIQEVINKLQFPRDFFEHKLDWEQFNRFSRRLRLDTILTSKSK